jgi:hypothetical protein
VQRFGGSSRKLASTARPACPRYPSSLSRGPGARRDAQKPPRAFANDHVRLGDALEAGRSGSRRRARGQSSTTTTPVAMPTLTCWGSRL